MEWKATEWQWEPNYPQAYPACRINDKETKTAFYRACILENAYLRVIALPELGGRIWSFYDKLHRLELVGQPETLMPQSLSEEEGDSRWFLRGGIQFHPAALGSPCAMHPVMSHADLPLDASAPGTLWVGSYDFEYNLFWQVGIRLLPDTYALELDYRVYNRSLSSLPYRFLTAAELMPGWQVSGPKVTLPHRTLPLLEQMEGSRSCAVLPDRLGAILPTSIAQQEHLLSTRFSEGEGWRWLAPHMTDAWHERWIPLPAIEHSLSIGSQGGIEWGQNSTLRLHSPTLRAEHTLQLETDSGQQLERTLSVYVEQPTQIRLPAEAGTVQSARLTSPTGETVWSFIKQDLRSEAVSRQQWQTYLAPHDDPDPQQECYLEGLNAFNNQEFARAENALYESAFSLAWRSPSHYLLALIAIRQEDLTRALIHLEECLIFNGGDSQAWMLRAACWRHLGRDEESTYERENARVLSPLDPLHRAEMYLSIDRLENADPGRLLKPVMRPEWIAKMARFYHEAGLQGDAIRLLGECLSAKPSRLLYQLRGQCFQQIPALQASAAEQFYLAKRAPEDLYNPS